MGGFPRRTSRDGFGPTLENKREVSDPKTEIGADAYNLNFWQVGGVSQICPQAVLTCTVSGGVVTTETQSLAFDPNGVISKITFTYLAVGWYSFSFASEYPDERGVNVPLSFVGGIIAPLNQIPYRGTHTGSNNAAVLTDSTKSWATNELVGKFLANRTDGSRTIVTANTANTVTGVLAGGTDNDWDTGDVYQIGEIPLSAAFSLTSSTAGELSFGDVATGPADITSFMLILF